MTTYTMTPKYPLRTYRFAGLDDAAIFAKRAVNLGAELLSVVLDPGVSGYAVRVRVDSVGLVRSLDDIADRGELASVSA